MPVSLRPIQHLWPVGNTSYPTESLEPLGYVRYSWPGESPVVPPSSPDFSSPLASAGVSRPMIRLVVVLMVWRAAVNISEVMP